VHPILANLAARTREKAVGAAEEAEDAPVAPVARLKRSLMPRLMLKSAGRLMHWWLVRLKPRRAAAVAVAAVIATVNQMSTFVRMSMPLLDVDVAVVEVEEIPAAVVE
jgi:uncharacterized protein (DUF2062 family)